MKSLLDVPVGQRVRIARINSTPDARFRLLELGFRENSVIRCVNKGIGCIVFEVCNARVGLNHTVARAISVSGFDQHG